MGESSQLWCSSSCSSQTVFFLLWWTLYKHKPSLQSYKSICSLNLNTVRSERYYRLLACCLLCCSLSRSAEKRCDSLRFHHRTVLLSEYYQYKDITFRLLRYLKEKANPFVPSTGWQSLELLLNVNSFIYYPAFLTIYIIFYFYLKLLS